MTRPLPRVWLITDRRQVPSGLPHAVARALSAGPAGSIGVILREKDMAGRGLLLLAKALRTITRHAGAPFVVNGRLDVALASDADGVHLGGDAPPVTAIKPLTGQLWLGVSVHPNEDIPPEATYALLSPIFATRSKPGAAPLGLGALRDRRGGPIPVFALGGITQENAGACLAAGAAGVAVLGGVLPHPDPAGAAAALLNAISGSGA